MSLPGEAAGDWPAVSDRCDMLSTRFELGLNIGMLEGKTLVADGVTGLS